MSRSVSRSVHSVGSLLGLARSHGLDLETTATDLDDTGLDFAVLHAHDDEGTAWILRAPRRPEVFASTQIEKRALDVVRPFLKPSVPDFVVHTETLVAYPKLEGVVAMSLWPATPTPTFLASYAELQLAFQRIPRSALEAGGVPLRTVAADRELHAKAMHETRAALEPSAALWRRWQRWLEDDASWPRELALGHGDLHPGHLLLGPTGAIWGILDWTEVAVADPSVDLALFYGCYGADAFDTVLDALTTGGGLVWPQLRAHAIERWTAFPALGAAWALRTGNATALEFSRTQVAANAAG